jgi:hypothetical protein
MAVAALIIIALYFGREIFVPVALSVLLSFVLAPFVIRLNSLRIPRTASVLIVVFSGSRSSSVWADSWCRRQRALPPNCPDISKR